MVRPDGAGNSGFEGKDPQPGSCGDLIERFLLSRGLVDQDAREAFLHPRWNSVQDPVAQPGALPGAEQAAIRLVEAVRGKKSIAIYGDYDVDGIMGSSILYHVLKTVDPECALQIYTPHRIDEGYGLNEAALETLASDGVDLVVTVDCGVTAVDLAQRAHELGLELIITDHHAFALDDGGRQILPEPDVLVHPARPDAPAAFTELCGAAVAFKVAWAFLQRWFSTKKLPELGRSLLLDLMPFVAMATIADVVPLVGENRVLTAHGLALVRQTKNRGLRALLEACRLADPKKPLLASDIAFRVAPVLNAAGRLGSAEDAVILMTTASDADAQAIAKRLVKLNKKRQEDCRVLTEEAEQKAKSHGMLEPACRVIVLADENWHLGLVGICCSRLAERYGRPVVLLKKTETTCRGSARSIAGYSVHAALTACAAALNDEEDVLVFGGHTAAAGLTVATDSFEQLVEAMQAHAAEAIQDDDVMESVDIDCAVSLSELDTKTVGFIEAKLNPFGAGNPAPRLLLSGCRVTTPVRMGGDGTHLRARVSCDGISRDAVWWSGATWLERFHEAERQGQTLDLVVEPEIDRWRGHKVCLRIVDARLTGATQGDASGASTKQSVAQSTI